MPHIIISEIHNIICIPIKRDIDMNIYLFKILELPQRLGGNLPAKQKTQETQF